MNVRDLIGRYNAAWNTQDLDAIASMHHLDVVVHNHTTSASRRARCAAATTSRCASGPLVEWDVVDVFPIEDGLIRRKDVYSASHRPRAPKD